MKYLKVLMLEITFFGVHINGINGKDQKTKLLGNNPFEWLGLRFNSDGTVATPIEYNGNGWDIYKKLDPIKLSTAMNQSFWNNGYKLSHWYKIYDWNSDDGYNNFSNWVK